MLDGMYVTKSISTGLYPNLDLWTANKLQITNFSLYPLEVTVQNSQHLISYDLLNDTVSTEEVM